MNSSREKNAENALTDAELQTLARRHSMILRQFRARLERERSRREQQAFAYTMAQQMAAIMVAGTAAQNNATQAPAAGGNVAENSGSAAPHGRKKSRAGKGDGNASSPFAAARAAAQHGEIAFAAGSGGNGSGGTGADEPGGGNLFPAPGTARRGEHFVARPVSPVLNFFRLIGGDSLVFSIVLHAVLFVLALFWVVSVYVEPEESPPMFFATGSGGGRGGEHPSYADVQKSRSRAAKFGRDLAQYKIVSKISDAKVVMPEMPELPRTNSGAGQFSSERFSRSLLGGNLSSGSGGGLGGGVGRGTGVGIGNARNYVGKFQTTQKILGTNVTAARLAVYMDSSSSMTEVLNVVREDVLKKFPTADVYEIFGCLMNARMTLPTTGRRDETSEWERKKKQLLTQFDREKKSSKVKSAQKKAQDELKKQQKAREKAARRRNRDGVSYEFMYGNDTSTWKKMLSSFGTELLEKWAGNSMSAFGPSSFDLSAWLNMVFTEGGYDAVIVVADFQDYRDNGRSDESEILDKWVAAARENGQRCYFFTTEMLPQRIFRVLAEQTGGDLAIPKETAKNSDEARATAEWLRKNKTTKSVSASAIASQKRSRNAPSSATSAASTSSTATAFTTTPTSLAVPAENFRDGNAAANGSVDPFADDARGSGNAGKFGNFGQNVPDDEDLDEFFSDDDDDDPFADDDSDDFGNDDDSSD